MKQLDPFLNARTGAERSQALELAALVQAQRAKALETGESFARIKMLPAMTKSHRVHHLEQFSAKAKGAPLNRGIRPAGFGTNVSRWNKATKPFGVR
jgi:hypothetical protein